MLPAVNIKPARRNTRPRPISSTDSAASTGLASNPNGTYVANPFPTTAQNGMQGQFGAMLPSTSIPNTPLYNMLTTGGGATQQTRPNTPLYNMLTTGGGALQQPTPVSGQPVSNSSQHISSGSFSQEAAMAGVLSRLEMGDMSVISQIPQADLQAMGLGDLATVTGTDPAGEPTDFQKTETYKKNVENGIPLNRQLRWDEKKRKYITVGEWMRQERKKYNKKGKYVGDRRSRSQEVQPEETKDEQYHGTIQQLGIVSFNTATG